MSRVFLCTTDATPASLPALRFALELADASGASLVLLHVLEGLDSSLARAGARRTRKQADQRLHEATIAAMGRRVAQQLREANRRPSRVAVEVIVEAGPVAATVLKIALARSPSLIVLGRGRKPRAIAPVAERIARLSPRPVLLVPSKWTSGARVRLLRPGRKLRRAAARGAS